MAVDYLRPFLSHTNMLDIKEEGLSTDSKSQKKTIHSGHFMVSRVHEPNVDDDEEEAVSPFSDDNKGFDFLNAVKKTSTTYNFGNAIDESLTKLFECMTLAYSGSITSPRWKQFRGLHVSQKQRIRLNNLIWREWHMQYIYQKSPMVCQFAMPLSDDIHSKPEAVVLEGKYWKRRLDVVTAEYKKWRRYYKDQAQRLQLLQTFGGMTWQQDTSHLSEMELLERVKDVTFIPCLGSGIRGDEGIVMQGHSNTDMALEMDFYDDFFNSLNNGPFSFPNPRELNHYGRSDLIQPGLLQLQPNLEECMDTDSLQLDLLTAKIPGAFSSSFHSSIGPAFLQESQSHVEMPQESDALLDFFSNTQGPSSSGQNTNQMSMSAAPSHALHQQPQQQQQQQQQQMLSPLAQLMTDNSNAMMESASQNIAFQLNSSVDNHNNNGGQIGLSHSPSIFVDGNQAFTLVSPGVAVTNNSSNINMSLMNTTDQKPIGGNNINVSGGGGGANLAELMTQMLQQEAQKNLQQQLQLQQKQQQLQQQQQKQQQLQQQQQKQQQQLQQQKQQQQQRQQLLQRQQQQQQQRLQQRAKALPLAPKVSPQAQRPTQQDLLQQLLQQQHPPFQQSPSAQSPLLAQSLTSSPSTSPLHNTIDRGLSNTSPHNRTDSQGYSPLSASTSPGITHLSSSPQQQQKKGGRQGRGAHKQSPVRRNSGGGSGGASGVMSDLAKMAAGKKKDGPFAVPQAKSVASTRVNRKIAPAPAAPVPIAPYVPSIPQNQVTVPSSGATASACQDSYLAKLLKNGTYQGAMINVKKEFSQQKQLVSQQHLLSQGIGQSSPIQTTTNLYQQIQNAAPSPPSSATAIVCQIGPQPGSDTLITVPLAGQIQASSLFAGTSVGNLGLGQLSPQTLANVVLPVPLGGQQMEGVSASPAESQHQQASVFARLSEEKVSSVPSSPNSSVTSPPPAFNIKPSSSPPQASMDTSNSLVDPSSPFSMVTMSPSTVGDPTSPAPSDIDFMPDSRRAAHLSAEQKRRWNLKTGFDMLQQLVPSLSQNPRVSKATMLQKTAEFCKKLKAERLEMQKEATILKREIESLNTAISGVQAQLPETGVPMTRQRKDQMREMFDDYVCHRTKENWKFWIFSAIMNPLYDSYCSSVSTASMEELCKTSLTWLDQYCSLVTLRPRVLHSLTKFSTSTSILTEPLRVKDQALQAVEKHPKKPK